MSIRCLVIDDEPLALNVLAGYIRQTPSLQLVDVTTNPLHGLQRILAGETDLVFLDIQMKKLNGIELLKKAGTAARFILTTAFAEYALEGYEYSIADYLLKPISYERFLKAVDKISLPERIGGTLTSPAFFFVKSEYKLLRIDYADVLCLEALRDYVAIHTVSGTKILTLQSLSSFEKELPPHHFIRVHKSYIIPPGKISYIEKNRIVLGSMAVPIGDTYRANLLKHTRQNPG